jgi:L-alanine-DL-glutamate epimerase-like enolase superfamily enzyme
VLALEAADVIVTDPHQLGSLTAFRDMGALCRMAGIPFVKHAFGDLGVTTAAAMHVLAALPGPVLAHQQFIQICEHQLLESPLVFEDGHLKVPTGPGLGIELDRDAIEHYGDIYRRFGEFEGYSPGFEPNPVPDEYLRGAAQALGD